MLSLLHICAMPLHLNSEKKETLFAWPLSLLPDFK